MSTSNQHPFVEPLFRPYQYSLDDVRSVFGDAILITQYLHTKFPGVLNDTLSLRDIGFHRTTSQEVECVLIDLDGMVHPSNPDGRPSPHGSIPFNAYDSLLARKTEDWDENRPSLYSAGDEVNTAAPYKTYRQILEALFYILLWSVSSVSKQTLGWMERGHVPTHQLLRILKHRKEREAFMWDASEIFAQVDADFKPLVAELLRPLWLLVSEAHFASRGLSEEERNKKLESVLIFNKVVAILRAAEGFDLRIATSIPVPGDESDDEL